MADIKNKYGTAGQDITITLASLANNSARESTYVSNATDLFTDALVVLKVKTGASGTTSTGTVEVYAYGTVDGGTTYTDTCTGSDAGVTLTSPTNLRLIGVINAVANATTYKSAPMSVANAFGGSLPERWGIVVVNKTGGALDSTEGNHTKDFQGVMLQAV